MSGLMLCHKKTFVLRARRENTDYFLHFMWFWKLLCQNISIKKILTAQLFTNFPS